LKIIDHVIIYWVLTLSFGVRLQRTLASLKREYETESRKTMRVQKKAKTGQMTVRFVAVYNDEDEKHHIYITNIQKDILNAKDIAKLY
jgi:hypothetical protein